MSVRTRAKASQHAWVREADRAGGRVDGGAVADEVLGAFEAEGLLVAEGVRPVARVKRGG